MALAALSSLTDELITTVAKIPHDQKVSASLSDCFSVIVEDLALITVLGVHTRRTLETPCRGSSTPWGPWAY